MSPPRRSKKRSAANSIANKRLSKAVFYLDESIYSKKLLERLKNLGAKVEHAGGAIKFGTPDDQWLTVCGNNGWIVLMRDKRVRYRRLEREALRSHNVAAFVLTSSQVTADETADIVESLVEKFANMSVSEPKPFLYAFGRGRKMSRVNLNR